MEEWSSSLPGPGKSLQYPPNRRLGEYRNWSGRYGEIKILTSPGLEIQTACSPKHSQSHCGLHTILVLIIIIIQSSVFMLTIIKT
jgi:hypothetical protein